MVSFCLNFIISLQLPGKINTYSFAFIITRNIFAGEKVGWGGVRELSRWGQVRQGRNCISLGVKRVCV